jgi:HAMP domain-containing protein
VGVTQIIFGLVIVAMLLFLGGYYAWRQVRNLRALRMLQEVSPDDRRDAHRQAWRRLICSGFMLIFAGLLVGSFFLEGEAQRLADQAKASRDRGEEPVFTPEQRDFQRFWGWYWLGSLLVLLAIIILAAVDVFAIRRTGQRLHKQLQEERRAMIAEQLARLRNEQNEREVR